MVSDAGQRRYLSYSLDFDTRSVILGMVIKDDWTTEVKEIWANNQAQVRQQVCIEFGKSQLDKKIQNFIAIDSKPSSVLAYHNEYFGQIRRSFIMGNYYPSLVGASALGERILNHLVLDQRDNFTDQPEYNRVSKKQSFDNWPFLLKLLSNWGVLLPETIPHFKQLLKLRNQSIHFDPKTYGNIRSDAILAIASLRSIIEFQFGTFGNQPWYIAGTNGNSFIKKKYEANPFIKRYFAENCPFVGPYYSAKFESPNFKFFDHSDYGQGNCTDEEYAEKFNKREIGQLAKIP